MTPRLILAIISTILEEAAVIAIVLWVLPQIGIRIPLAGLIALMVAWLIWSVTIYRLGRRALERKPIVGLPHMVGSKGEVVSPLAPEGLVRIRGELWKAKSASGELAPGGEVVVVGQDSLKLVVRQGSASDDLEKIESSPSG